VGAARGGWESFRAEEEEPYEALKESADFGFNDDDDVPSHNRRGRHWSGGAF